MDYLHAGLITQDSARLFCRTGNVGTLTAVVNGKTFIGDALDPSVDDGTGAVVVTGLTAGREYNATVSDGTESRGLKIRTPSDYNVGLVGSCALNRFVEPAMEVARSIFKPVYNFWLGDTPYNDWTGTEWGIYSESTDGTESAGTSVDNYYSYHRRMLKKPYLYDDRYGESLVIAHDDHEFLDNFNNDAVYMRDRGGSPITWLSADDATAQAQVDTAKGVAQQALRAYQRGNQEVVGGADYFTWTVGTQKFILLDCIAYKQNPATGIFLGDVQLQWFKDQLTNAGGIEFITVLSSKHTTQGNADGWYDFLDGVRDELYQVFDHIEANQVTGVAFISGDKHHSFVKYNENPRSLGTPTTASPHLCMVACSLSTALRLPPDMGETDVVWRYVDEGSGTWEDRRYGGFCLIWETSPGRIDYKIFNEMQGVIWHGYQLAGSNALHYPEQKIAG